jgi:hypothetical protein
MLFPRGITQFSASGWLAVRCAHRVDTNTRSRLLHVPGPTPFFYFLLPISNPPVPNLLFNQTPVPFQPSAAASQPLAGAASRATRQRLPDACRRRLPRHEPPHPRRSLCAPWSSCVRPPPSCSMRAPWRSGAATSQPLAGAASRTTRRLLPADRRRRLLSHAPPHSSRSLRAPWSSCVRPPPSCSMIFLSQLVPSAPPLTCVTG